MHSGGGGGSGRNPVGRAASTSSAASPSSSSSAVSTPHLGFDPIQQQQQQQQQSRQPLQQQLLRKPEGNEAILQYQAGGHPGAMGPGNFSSPPGVMPMPQQSRKFFELAQQHGSAQEGQNQNQGPDQQQLNPLHQAYLQYTVQAQHNKSVLAMQSQQAAKMGLIGPSSGKDQVPRMGNLKMQELVSMQQAANQAQASSSKNSLEHFSRGEKQMEQGQPVGSDPRGEPKPTVQPGMTGQLMPGNIVRPPMQTPQPNLQSMTSNPIALAHLQAVQTWLAEHNIDPTLPGNSNLMAQLIPQLQSRLFAQLKANEGYLGAQSNPVPVTKQQVSSPHVANENSPRANAPSDVSGQSSAAKAKQVVSSSPFGSNPNTGNANNNSNNSMQQQFAVHGRENQVRPPVAAGNGMPPMHPSSQGVDHSFHAKSSLSSPENAPMQYVRPPTRPSAQASTAVNERGSSSQSQPQAGSAGQVSQRSAFTKQQLHVLKAQILAFRRIKKGEGSLPQELLRAIVPPPLELQQQQQQPPQQQFPPGAGNAQEKSAGKVVADRVRHIESNEKDAQVCASSSNAQNAASKEEAFGRDEKPMATVVPGKGMLAVPKEVVPSGKEEQQQPPSTASLPVKTDHEVERGTTPKPPPVRSDSIDRGKTVAPQAPTSDAMQVKKPAQPTAVSVPQPKDVASSRKYHGPLFDFPFFTRKHDSMGTGTTNSNNNLTLAYDVKDILSEEGVEVLNKKRTENIKKIGGLLAVNLERKRIRPDLVLRLQIEEKKLRLLDIQARLRDEMDQQQQEIMAMPDRPYRKFVRLCERQRIELTRQVQASQKAVREKQLKSIFQWRKKLLEAHWGIRDARTARNRGVAKYHERMLREFSKRKDDDRNKRMEALKNNDVERYREMLLEQQTNIDGDGAERYAVLSSFLTQTEEYLYKLGGKITAAKNQQEVEEAANAAVAAARLQGLSEEEVRSAAACAGEEVMIRNRFREMNAPKDGSSVNKYYTLAHAVNERVLRQPSMLRAGTLRDYQLVGLQWMLSLYNNKLNGILADEMGLGKTVQVMALIAYLMEFKGNYGPHLIIVPNAVLVNWKSELHTWLPSVSCIYYVGGKEQRSKLFSQDVLAMKFNVLVTTYEFIMYDRSKLSKIDWKYIVIDEAQRMKDRESVLARDLDRYRCQRRLLLTGTPLQNDLKELWSLLNLLLPEVFDSKKAFHDWFSKPFQREGGPTPNAEDDWLETEKKVIVIHRLHQILEPFMLRRRVEDVEGSLPPKVSIVLRCRMSAFQSAIYDWIKATGTIRVDPEDEKLRLQRNPAYQAKLYRTLNNRCMELRKTCNHPLLNYPYFNNLSKEFIVRSCGKLWILDRILMKLQNTGHRVLLFSTMTKLLDLLEEYLQWRRLVYRRIDGTTSLEDRESAIVDFNSPGSDCFIFLLSIRAAGRGLNLQTADTVIIYDPDPNPKNEEQAVARAHRIGQTREVKVIYMEAVVDKISSQQKEDELRSGGTVDSEDDLAGKDRYMGSIESLIRSNIQQYKIDMADEVINAGRFDQRTTHEERRMTLETLLHDDERYQETVHDVPSLQEVNRMIARSEEEVELFDQMDEELDWIEETSTYDQVPKWLRAGTREVNATNAALSKRPSKAMLFGGNNGVENSEMGSDSSPKTERRRGRPKKHPNYKELDDDIGEYSDASSDERNGYSNHEEEGEIGEFEDEEFDGAIGAPLSNKEDDLVEEDEGPVLAGGYEYPRATDGIRNNNNQMLEEGGSSGSSSDSRRVMMTTATTTTTTVSPVTSQKFGSLSALDGRPGSVSRRTTDDLEEGEIAVSGDSHMDHQQSGSWIHEREEVEDEQVVQPRIKRKRSLRVRPRQNLVERPEEKSSNETSSAQHGGGNSSFLQFQAQLRGEQPETRMYGDSPATRNIEQNDSGSKSRRNSLPSRRVGNASKPQASPKSSRLNSMSASASDASEHPRDIWDGGKGTSSSGPSGFAPKISESVQRKCKTVVTKLIRRIEKEGSQIVPLLTDLWKRIENSNYASGSVNNILDLQKINQRVERSEYNGIPELIVDVQSMLRSAMNYYAFSHEVRSEARKVHDLFFDILKITSPDTEFREARSWISFSAPPGNANTVLSPRQTASTQNKRLKMISDVDPPEPSPPQKAQHRGGPMYSGEDTPRGGGRSLAQQKETTKHGSGSREQFQQDDPPRPTHPGDLVICKKKRKDREKTLVKVRTGPVGPVGPVSPPSMARGMKSPVGPGSSSGGRDTRLTPQSQGRPSQSGQAPNGSGGASVGGGSVGWANPVKRLRTDSGKRRPSHL